MEGEESDMKKTRAKKLIQGLCAVVASACILVGSSLTAHAEGSYTYCYDYWGEVQDSPNAYDVVSVYTFLDLGLDKQLNNPAGLTAVGDMLFLCDSGNNRILQFRRTAVDKLEFVRSIEEMTGDVEVNTFKNPKDFQIDEDGYYYVADTDNNRIVKMDSDLNYIMSFYKPVDATLDADLVFQPTKLVVDGAGRVYCIATGINKGLIKYEADGQFSGFVGATPVVFDFMDYVWKRLASQEQRDKLLNFVPTEYDNLFRDHDGFIYVVSASLAEEDLKSESAQAVRKLNLKGDDILIRNGDYPVYGDLYMGSGGGHDGPSQFVDITVFDNDVYVCLDKNRGRLFAYDDQGRLLYTFGGNGNEDGYFRMPVAIDHMGYDLFVLDSLDKSITIFTPNNYGKMIFQAIDQFDAGAYTESGETWQKVMDLNGNYDLAYIGVGRSLLRQERYKEAMKYFELKYNDDNYSKALKQYRKEWVEEHILVIFILVFAVLIVPMIIGRIGKIKHEIDTADIFKF